MKIDDVKPYLSTIEYTEKLVSSQTYTYNEVGITYNSDIYYGGLYGSEGQKPMLKEVYDYKVS